MKTKRRKVVSTAAVLVVASTVLGQSADLDAQAKSFLAQLTQGEFAATVETFDQTMRKVLPADKPGQTWQALVSRAGPYQKLCAPEGRRSSSTRSCSSPASSNGARST